MTIIDARIPMGNTVVTQKIELYTVSEAKQILAGKEWDFGGDIYSVEKRGCRIGWLASYPNGEGIYIETR